MELKQIKYFLAIAEHGSLAAAAEAVGIAQPSISVQLKNLEGRLGTQLFIRSPRGVTLTDAGSVFVERAHEILDAVDRAKRDVRQAGETPSGKVVFGFPSSVSMVLSVPLAETIRLNLPEVRLRAVDAMSGFIKEWLDEETIDLAILYETTGLKNAEITTLLEEDLHFYAPPDLWPFETPPGEPIRLDDLRELELVLPSKSHGLRMLIDRVCRAAGVHLNVVVEMDSLTQIKSLVQRGSAFTILAPAAAGDFEERGELASSVIIDPKFTRAVQLVRNPKHVRTRAALEVERTTISVVQELVERGIWRGRLT
ncbi:LysR family transcriptional regulator [Donghicola sp. C2-DW-16]|uniref:LysR family transcriptional regulator n=1 Tax=Donghicola mangrovi TaxID=2729614 RepID=A0ABX2PE63_9RHOB|nr:LysR family transcriptional regulator [Donghicola mangrovi]NVO27307.1 LysR family transcriptional regulator [Donghicola mangrovi]